MNENFFDFLIDDLKDIQKRLDELVTSNTEPEKAQALTQAAHRLAGAALTAGFDEIGQAARELENGIRASADKPSIDHVRDLTIKLANAFAKQRAMQPGMAQSKINNQFLFNTKDGNTNHLIHIVDDDIHQARNLADQISRFGYQVNVFSHLPDLSSELKNIIPSVILMDIVFPEGELAGADEIRSLRKEIGDQLPVFFISVRTDTTARIQAIRAGGKGYFPKPVDIDALMDEINSLNIQIDPQPYRVLIVDDSEIQAKTNAMHLHKFNIETSIITKADEVLEDLENFHPDLILLDLYMPDFSGLELAQMIRQIKAYVGIPIVFLSAESDREKQLNAVGQGGDDFLTKPIKPDLLIAAVTSRIERYRKLQTLMLRDGLTGLLNHTTIRESLSQEINRAKRSNQPLAVAMLDIDQFKNVNDSYGHATGDKVLRSLAQMLSLRLRRTDLIGRYGGEEFLILFPNTTEEEAAQLMDELRDSFSQVIHIAQGHEFRITFSCGVAGFPALRDLSALSEAADRALYEAKRKGRNRVISA
jgi:diguanylate cyclase (GGDEF)-like protein